RPLIGQPRLIADKQDLARKTVRAKVCGHLEAAMAAANDDDALRCHICASGRCTLNPSRSSVIAIWHDRRLVPFTSDAAKSSIAPSSPEAGPTADCHSSAT